MCITCGKRCEKQQPLVNDVKKRLFILTQNKTFPHKIAEKRYKLRKFAPNYQIVDNSTMPFIINNKQFTLSVHIYVITGA